MTETLTQEEKAALYRRLEVVEAKVDPVPDTDMLVGALTGGPGIVYDEGVARATPCNCLSHDGGDECFSKGVRGPLSAGQQALFCNPRVTREATPAQAAQIEIWDRCGDEVQPLPAGERLAPYFSCVDRERKARGITDEPYGS